MEIRSLVASHGNIDYDPLIADLGRETLFALSSLRRNLLSWFPFRKEADALEIGAGYGALSGLLMENFSETDLLEEDPEKADILRKRFSDRSLRLIHSLEETDRKYDYVFLIDHEDLYRGHAEDVLRKCGSYLKNSGVLCVGFRNRDGIKYDCGAIDDKVKEPFATEELLSLAEFTRSARLVFPEIQVYCPFPDAYYTQAVYRSDCMPTSSFADRVRAYDPYNSPLIKNENTEYQIAIRDGTLFERSNFYLVFLSRLPLSCPIEKVILSPDRAERSYMTIFEKERVYKKAIRTEGTVFLHKAAENAEKLMKRGIHVVPQSFENGMLVMPHIHSKASLDVIAEAVAHRDEEQILQLFDSLYADICLCRPSDRNGDSIEEKRGKRNNNELVLSEAYIDMIPYNAFLTKDGFCYYDQEFVWRDVPANYIMFRAIRYTSIHIGDLFDAWREELYSRYGINESLCEIYMKKENEFVNRNRRRDLYHQFYDWAYIAPERIEENRRYLLHPGEDRELQKIHAIQLDLLKQFDAFCRTNGLIYFALHGTLLGAARHRGFIPWDDDVDLGMPREDYDKLVELYPNHPGAPYLQSMGKEGRIFYGGYAKFRDENSVAIEKHNRYFHGHVGVSIDIFPLDYCDEDSSKRDKLQKRITEVQRCIYARCYENPAGVLDDVPGNELTKYYLIGKHIPLRIQYLVLNRLLRSTKKSPMRTILACYYGNAENKNLFRDKDLDDLIYLPFEDMDIPVPQAYHRWLVSRYGENYCFLPKKRIRKHQNMFINLDKLDKLDNIG